jgi:hypothetical protein
MIAAFITAGLGLAPPNEFFQNCVNNAAAPATCGAACEVPELQLTFASTWPLTLPPVPERDPVITVPGAVMSGLTRPSDVGPRLEVLFKSSMLFAPALISVRIFSELATAIKFFAAFGRVNPDVPLFPAEKTRQIGSIFAPAEAS